MKFKSDIEVQAGLRDGGNDIGTAGQILSSTGSQTNWIDQDSIVASEAKLVFIECKNTSGVTISKGTPVYQTGTVGATDVIEVDVADASDEDKMAAIGLLQTDLANNAFGKVVITGELLNITTSLIDGVTPVTGDTIYVKSGGGLTLTKPTGVNFIQNIGLVGKVSGGNAGSITVSSIMRSNDVPTPLYIDHTNQRLGIGTTSPSAKLEVNGQTVINSTGLTEGFQWFNDTNEIFSLEDTSGAGELLLLSSNSVKVKLNANGTSYFNGGNVGIGTTSPNHKLDIYSNENIPLRVHRPSNANLNSGGAWGIGFSTRGDAANSTTDTRAGIFSYYNGNLFLAANNSNIASSPISSARLTILNNGNVGIGTTGPGSKLVVSGSFRAGNNGYDSTPGGTAFSHTLSANSGSTRVVNFDGNGSNPSVWWNNANTRLGAIDGETEGLAFWTNNAAGNWNKNFYIQPTQTIFTQNVGIGMTAPLQPLSIENSSSPLIKIRNTTNGSGAAIEFNDNGTSATTQNGRISYYHSDSQSQGGGSSFWLTGQDDQTLVLANNGRVVVQKSGSASEVGYGFYDDVNTGMYRVSADALGFATGGTRRLDMNNSGVRIGTGSRVTTILDQDNMSSNSNTALATQQSIKAYVDNSVAAIITPAAPSTVTSTIVGETIEIAFNQSTTSDIDYYQVWSSDDGGDYGIIGQITSDDFSTTMTVVDTTFVTGGTMSYRVYAVRQGVYSSAATTSKSYTVSALSVTNMTVVNLNTAYYIQYEKPNSRFIDHIEIWMDSQTTQAALNRTNATLVYSGQNHSYMRNVNTSNNFHQFWVEIVTS